LANELHPRDSEIPARRNIPEKTWRVSDIHSQNIKIQIAKENHFKAMKDNAKVKGIT
jgi:hypothetical protein